MAPIISSILMMFIMAITVYGQAWDNGHATYYTDMSGSQAMGGACGYGNLNQRGYGLQITALSTALFNNGQTCGACFQVQCTNDPGCAPGSIIVTATDLCPSGSTGGWCNPPLKHFDLSMPMFVKIAKDYNVGHVPIQFRRVSCQKQGGMQFTISGNPYAIMVLVYNVGGAGQVTAVSIKGSSTTGWIPMSRNWGQNWQTNQNLVGQSLSFSVTTSDGKVVQSINCVPANWKFGQNFQGSQFFPKNLA